MEKLTREDILKKYGDTAMKFSRYYKYSFTYKGIAKDGNIVVCSEGGDSNDIYRLEVIADEEQSLTHIDPSYCVIYSPKMKELHHYCYGW